MSSQWEEAIIVARNLTKPTDPDPAFVVKVMNAMTLEKMAASLQTIAESIMNLDSEFEAFRGDDHTIESICKVIARVAT